MRAAAAVGAAVVTLAAGSALLLWGSAGMLAEIGRPGPAPLGSLVGAAAAGAAWLVLAWLTSTFLLEVVATLSRAARPVRRETATVSPPIVRRLAAAALGAGLLAGPVAGPAAAAVPAPVAGSDVPGEVLPGWTADRPAPPPAGDDPAPPATTVAHRPSATAWVRVRPGDSLWAVAARHLGPGATPAAVADEWPRWYAANRDQIGPDPHLIRPGTRLRVPASSASTAP
jgi:nucleoid-associated protein YgaU